MNCDRFIAACRQGEDSVEMREHLRSCPRCLDFAVTIDPDFLFRSLGGEMTPPGGVDAFVTGVMDQLQVRAAEGRLLRRRPAFFYGWSAAAAIAIALLTFSIQRNASSPAPAGQVATSPAHAVQVNHEPRPVVENYDSSTATIVEVPTQNTGDLKVVMIFDESLPADL
jgi:hypothetical protein